jgi:hypothetical protein
MITDRALVRPDVPGVEPLLQQHRMPYTRATLPFTPAAAVAGIIISLSFRLLHLCDSLFPSGLCVFG